MTDRKIADWSRATLSNSFMFRLVMEKQELCRALIERILGIKIESITYMEAEKSIEARLASRGIRLDLYVVDEDGAAYDIEMQFLSVPSTRLTEVWASIRLTPYATRITALYWTMA